MKETRNYICRNPRGLTASNASRLVQINNRAECSVLIYVNGNCASAGNFIGILMLKIRCGDTVYVIAEGPDATAVADSIGTLLCTSDNDCSLSSAGRDLPSLSCAGG